MSTLGQNSSPKFHIFLINKIRWLSPHKADLTGQQRHLSALTRAVIETLVLERKRRPVVAFLCRGLLPFTHTNHKQFTVLLTTHFWFSIRGEPCEVRNWDQVDDAVLPAMIGTAARGLDQMSACLAQMLAGACCGLDPMLKRHSTHETSGAKPSKKRSSK